MTSRASPHPSRGGHFQAAHAEDATAALAALVERLLSSPHYGERMAQHWLDVVRYADSSGFANDFERGNAWRYRGYVVRSFNQDKPNDQFMREQIAGDEIAPQDPEHLLATGFLRMGPWELTGMEVAKVARQRFLDDVTNSVGETFLAHSLQCARCHDHKFDPVPTQDYCAIQAVFATTQLAERPAPFLKEENVQGFEEKAHLVLRRAEHLTMLRQFDDKLLSNAAKWYAEQKLDRNAWDAAVAAAKQSLSSGVSTKKANATGKMRSFTGIYETARTLLQRQGLPEHQYPPKLVGFGPEDFGNKRVARKGLERLRWEMERYKPYALAVYSGKTPTLTSVTSPVRMQTTGELEQTAILAGGDPFSPTTLVRPGILSALTPLVSAELPTPVEGRRKAFAERVASPQNPLTTRAIVNRVWMWHFGRPIAGNPNNFGSTGRVPTHPELLDYLAERLVAGKWSFKALHREIMNSAAYQRSAQMEPLLQGPSREGLEQSYADYTPRRLSAEELRDAALHVTGELNPTLGGIRNRPEINLEAALQPRMVMGTFASAWVPNPLPKQRHRRSLYALKLRGLMDPLLEVFNSPAPDFSCERRDASTVTPQVFSMFNSQNSHSRALAMAARAVKESGSNEATLHRCFHLAFSRPPSAAELTACMEVWKVRQANRASLTPSPAPQLEVRHEAVEENTVERFSFSEKLYANAEFIPDLQLSAVDARTRALAEVCLAMLNSNEFVYLY